MLLLFGYLIFVNGPKQEKDAIITLIKAVKNIRFFLLLDRIQMKNAEYLQ